MNRFQFKLIAGAAAAALVCALIIAGTASSHAQARDGRFGVGIPEGFCRSMWRSARGRASGDRQVLRVRLGYVKGLSRSFTAIAGEFALDLESGAFRVSLNGLTPHQTYGVWLVDGAETSGTHGWRVRLATVHATGASAVVTGTLNAACTQTARPASRLTASSWRPAPSRPPRRWRADR